MTGRPCDPTISNCQYLGGRVLRDVERAGTCGVRKQKRTFFQTARAVGRLTVMVSLHLLSIATFRSTPSRVTFKIYSIIISGRFAGFAKDR
jgi:hypothetical protein